MGHRFTADGTVAEKKEEMVAAVLKMSAPTTMPLLRHVIGMVHFLSSYLQDMHSIRRPVNDLIKDNAVWAWGPAQDEACVKMKTLVASTPIMAYYDATKSICMSADASSYGIGGVLIQDRGEGRMKPVALTPTEQRYSQIQKVCLASGWACEKIDIFLCGLSGCKLLTHYKLVVPLINVKNTSTGQH